MTACHTDTAVGEALMPGDGRLEADGVGRRPCGHGVVGQPVQASSSGCEECLAGGEDWVELWLCQSCGWVACSDNSPNRHAHAHYEETDHPIAVRLRPGPRSRWCYVHHRIV